MTNEMTVTVELQVPLQKVVEQSQRDLHLRLAVRTATLLYLAEEYADDLTPEDLAGAIYDALCRGMDPNESTGYAEALSQELKRLIEENGREAA